MSDRSAIPPFFMVSTTPLLTSDQPCPPPAKRFAAVLVGVSAVVLLVGLSWAGVVAGPHGWLFLGAIAGYVAFVALCRAALRLWRTDWEDLAPDLRLFKDRSMRSELPRPRGAAPPVTALLSRHNSPVSDRENA